MTDCRERPFRLRRHKLWADVSVLCLAVVLSGCQTLGYYTQAIQGECKILAQRQSIEKLIADRRTPSELREKFKLVLQLRQFAEKELRLPTDDQYLRYVDVHHSFVVWDVHAARQFSLEPKTWWYPFVGSLKYHGYFSEAGARRYAQTLEKKGWEVYVEGVEAYSTLGWFKDPLLNTFIMEPEPELAETLFHELAHQRLFISGDTDFDEAFATAVGEEGVRRWLLAKAGLSECQEYAASLARNEQFVHLIMETREELKSLYGGDACSECRNEARGPKGESAARLRQQRELIIVRLRENHAKLKAEWGGNSGYDSWFAKPLNNAQLNTVAAYYDLVPGFRALLESNGGDLEKFFEQVRRLKQLKKNERHRIVKAAQEN